LLVVMVFMVVYYPAVGRQRDCCADLEPHHPARGFGFFGAVLTLPGIAGVILTIGMGVDSNVLIFERIREELRASKAASLGCRSRIQACVLTIIDTHVTTIRFRRVPFHFRDGPVRGFAVSLVRLGCLPPVYFGVRVPRHI